MPIRKDLQHFYRTPQYKAARARVVERAGNKCEQCGKPNGARVETVTGKLVRAWMCWRSAGSGWIHWTRRELDPPYERWSYLAWPSRSIRVVCTCAHLNHTPGDDRDENLRFLCQWCHLHYDIEFHKETRGARKDARRPLIADCGEEARP